MADRTYYWNGAGTLGHEPGIKKGEKLPANFSDPRLAGWLKDGTVTLVEPDTSAEKQGKIVELEAKIKELEEENVKLKHFSKDYAASEQKNDDLISENKKIVGVYQDLKANLTAAKSIMIEKLGEPSLSKKEKEELIELIQGV